MIEYKLVADKGQLPSVLIALEAHVNTEISLGWEPYGSLAIHHINEAFAYLIQPMIRTEEAAVKQKKNYQDNIRRTVIRRFPDILRAQRIKADRAAGKSWEEIAAALNRSPATVKGWTGIGQWYKTDIADDPELELLYREYQESHP